MKNSDKSFIVVMNDEEQYSIWPSDLEIPAGWKKIGEEASKQECLDYIAKAWDDMVPLSIRESMGG